MIEIIKSYAELINIGLFATIIGLLYRNSTISRLAIKDKSEAEVASLREINKLLEAREANANKTHQDEIRLLEKELAMYKGLSEMPEEKRIIAATINNDNYVPKNTQLSEKGKISEKLLIDESVNPVEDINSTLKNFFINKITDK